MGEMLDKIQYFTWVSEIICPDCGGFTHDVIAGSGEYVSFCKKCQKGFILEDIKTVKENLQYIHKEKDFFTDYGREYFESVYNRYQPLLQSDEIIDGIDDLSLEEYPTKIREAIYKLLDLRKKMVSEGMRDLADMIKWKINEGYGYFDSTKEPSLLRLRIRYGELCRLIRIAEEVPTTKVVKNE